MEFDSRFSDIIALVEATSTEQFFLWKEFQSDVKWESELSGKLKTITGVGFRPIVLCFTFAKINNKRICFWECTSEYQDYLIINEWIKENLPKVLHCNAMNFHQVIHEAYPNGWPNLPVVADDLFYLIKKAEAAAQTEIANKLKCIVQTLTC
jgi:hypothetical protein